MRLDAATVGTGFPSSGSIKTVTVYGSPICDWVRQSDFDLGQGWITTATMGAGDDYYIIYESTGESGGAYGCLLYTSPSPRD